MIKLIGMAAAAILGGAAALGLTVGINQLIEQRYEPIDGLVYSFIVGKVEGNDDLLASILSDDAEDIIKPGRHAYPGDAEKMGERYEIKRYPHLYRDGVMIYEITFYRPSAQEKDHYNVLILRSGGVWQVAKNSTADEMVIQNEIAENEGKVIHNYQEVKQ